MENKKTTLAGAAQFLVVVFTQLQYVWDGIPETTVSLPAIFTSAAVFIGLLFARDARKEG